MIELEKHCEVSIPGISWENGYNPFKSRLLAIHHPFRDQCQIIDAAKASDELLVLLTPWATDRPYIWIEIGLFLGENKRIVGVLHGLEKKDIAECGMKKSEVRIEKPIK